MDFINIFWCWILMSGFINLFGFLINIKVPLYKGKWDRNKKSPIYKLERVKYWDHYNVYRYSIDYNCYHLINDSSLLILIFICFLPFSCWFRFPYYKKEDQRYGNFMEKDIPDNLNLEKYYESRCKKDYDKYLEKLNLENYFKDKINNLNKDFNKHYNNE